MKKIKDHHYAIAALILLIIFWIKYIFPNHITAFQIIMGAFVLCCSVISITKYLIKQKNENV